MPSCTDNIHPRTHKCTPLMHFALEITSVNRSVRTQDSSFVAFTPEGGLSNRFEGKGPNEVNISIWSVFGHQVWFTVAIQETVAMLMGIRPIWQEAGKLVSIGSVQFGPVWFGSVPCCSTPN